MNIHTHVSVVENTKSLKHLKATSKLQIMLFDIVECIMSTQCGIQDKNKTQCLFVFFPDRIDLVSAKTLLLYSAIVLSRATFMSPLYLILSAH